ncbi:MAG: autotransporter domain-containing protein, partial [Planctomycetaceae bacterium]
SGGSGGLYGGGGAGGNQAPGATGGDFGGGGAGGASGESAAGGAFGGGAGAAQFGGTAGSGGFGAGDGGMEDRGGDGGDAMGGAVFVRAGGTLVLLDSGIANSVATAGLGGSGAGGNGSSGAVVGAGIHVDSGSTIDVGVSTGSVTIGDAIGGLGSINKSGTGELVLSGSNTYSGDTTVSAGRLAINGAVMSDTTVGAAGELGGNGTIIGNVTNSGILATGNSIGTLNINGNYTSNVGSTTKVEINDGGNTPGTNNDLLVVTGNVAINGGVVDVIATPGSYTSGTTYTFLTAGSLTGAFDSITDDLAFFDAQLGYTATDAYFTLIANSSDYASIGSNPNQRAVGTYLDSVSSGASGDLQLVLDELLPMTNGQVQNSLSQMSGDVHGSTSQFGIQSTSLVITSIGQQLRGSLVAGPSTSNRTTYRSSRSSEISLVSYQRSGSSYCDTLVDDSCRRCDQWRGWVVGYGVGGSADGDGNVSGIRYGMGGTTTGIERNLDENNRVGLFGGYVGASVDSRGQNQTNRTNGGQFGTFLTGHDGRFYHVLLGGMQFDDYESQRTIQLGGIARTARADYDGWQGFAYGERGLTLRPTASTAFQPFAGLQYVYLRQNHFAETGAGVLNLDVDGIDTHSLRSMLGARFLLPTYQTQMGYCVTPELSSLWMHEFLDTSSLVSTRFASVGGAGFAANGLDLGRDWAVLGGGLISTFSVNWQGRIDYNTQLNDRQRLHLGSAMVSYSW